MQHRKQVEAHITKESRSKPVSKKNRQKKCGGKHGSDVLPPTFMVPERTGGKYGNRTVSDGGNSSRFR